MELPHLVLVLIGVALAVATFVVFVMNQRREHALRDRFAEDTTACCTSTGGTTATSDGPRLAPIHPDIATSRWNGAICGPFKITHDVGRGSRSGDLRCNPT